MNKDFRVCEIVIGFEKQEVLMPDKTDYLVTENVLTKFPDVVQMNASGQLW